VADDDSFLSRWSRRKTAQRSGNPLPAEPPPAAPPVVRAPPQTAVAAGPATPVAAAVDAPAPAPAPAPSPPPPPTPTLDDVAQLTPQSDFAAFVKPEVDPQVRQAALKKLFADPHFNVMDGLDVYIDDYNTPDPLPPGMLRQLNQSSMLGLFADAEPAGAAGACRVDRSPADAPGAAHGAAADTPGDAPPGTPPDTPLDTPLDTRPRTPSDTPTGTLLHPAGSPAGVSAPDSSVPPPHEDADLQLQPDPAAGRPGPEPGAAACAGRPD
jgi:hypothetical protein